MYEIDFLPVGDNSKSGDAIAMRFTRPDDGSEAVVVIDAGYKSSGKALVEHVIEYYGTDRVDLAILTHPDGDHIGGMGEVIRGLRVERLWLHDLAGHGGSALPAASALAELRSVAALHGTAVEYPWAGQEWFGGALKILGPSQEYYSELVLEQVAYAGVKASVGVGGRLIEVARGVFDRIGGALGIERPLEPGTVNARNNSSMVTLWQLDGHTMLLTGDAGVPALDRAWDLAEARAWAAPLKIVQVPHHGSRRNASSAWLDRAVGQIGGIGGDAVISVVADSDDHPSSRVVNAYTRRGFGVTVTAGKTVCCPSPDAPPRSGWGPIQPLGPMDESGED